MPLPFDHQPTNLASRAPLPVPHPGRLLRMATFLMTAWASMGAVAADPQPAVAPAKGVPGVAAPSPAASSPADAAAAKPTAKPPVVNSNLDTQLFYQLLLSEFKANEGDVGTAYHLYMELGRRNQSGQLFQRATEIAMRARAWEQALTAAKAWRQASPQSREPSEHTAQILLLLNRPTELTVPLRTIIQLTPAPQQPQMLAALPRTVARLPDKKAAAEVVEAVSQPWRQAPLELAEAWQATAEAWLVAQEPAKSLAALQKSVALKPDQAGAGLVAVELMGQTTEAEKFVKTMLERPQAPTLLRLAYARKLGASQRYKESAEQLESLLKVQPDMPGARLTLAIVRLELQQADAAEAILAPLVAQTPPVAASGEGAQASQEAQANEREQAYLLMAQIADQRGQHAQASEWLRQADPKAEKIGIQAQRARLLMKQGKTAEARKLIRSLPETEPRDAVTKYQAEAQLLRDAEQWEEAYKVLGEASKRFPEDTDLMYDLALLAEKLKKFNETERLLRKAIELSPENPNALNALGYSFVERGIRLDEARGLILKALALRPADPFITDSLGWLEFRAGNAAEALRLLKEAHKSRPDAEIAAHLGEILWTLGQHEEAGRVWREAVKTHGDNETLKETMKRLKFTP